MSATEQTGQPRQQLTLFDSVCIIIGIIIGAGIYKSTPLIAQSVSGGAMLLVVFFLGGVLSLIGAACYAELATAYPREGGDYVYLTQAYGRRTGFLFAWSELWIVRPGNIGAMAFVFAEYANQLLPLPLGPGSSIVYAGGSVLLLTGVNVLGVQTGKWTQNVLTMVKVVGLLGVFAVGMYLAAGRVAAEMTYASEPFPAAFGLAMILVMFTFGGWNEMSYVAAEVRHPQRNILRALLLGTAAVTAIYLLICTAFVGALGIDGVRRADAVAADVLKIPFGNAGAVAISLLICISCLGATSGMIFTGARVYYALGTEHRLYGWLGRWNARAGSPVRSLFLQGAVTLAMVVFFGLYKDGFTRLVVFTAPFFWFFLLLAAISLFVLRVKDRDIPRTYRVTLYPLTPILFCVSTLYMLYSSIDYASGQRYPLVPWYLHFDSLWPVAIFAVGLLASFLDPARPGERGPSGP